MARVIALFAVAAALLGVAAGWFFVLRDRGGEFAQCRSGVVAGSADIGGPFSLIDGTGATLTDADVITKPTLVYFGYAFCPDVCPVDMSRNALAVDMLSERGVDAGLVFITVDPARDTPEVVTDFAHALHPDAIGLTGSADAVAEAAKAYRVYFRRADDDPDYYLVDHSTFTYLMAPGVGFLEFYPSDVSPDDMADSVECYSEAL